MSLHAQVFELMIEHEKARKFYRENFGTPRGALKRGALKAMSRMARASAKLMKIYSALGQTPLGRVLIRERLERDAKQEAQKAWRMAAKKNRRRKKR